MRTNKEMVVMYMQDMTIKKGEDFKGFTTQELSADLNILKEGKKEEKHLSCFSKLIGVNGSLKNAVQLAKAAILYPEDAMSTLIVGDQGTGKTLLTIIWYPFFKIYEKQCIEKEQAEALEA